MGDGMDFIGKVVASCGGLGAVAVIIIKMVASMLAKVQAQKQSDAEKIETLKNELHNVSIASLNASIVELKASFAFMQDQTVKKFENFTDKVSALQIALNQNAFEIRSARETMELCFKHWAGEMERMTAQSKVKQIGADVFRVESKKT